MKLDYTHHRLILGLAAVLLKTNAHSYIFDFSPTAG